MQSFFTVAKRPDVWQQLRAEVDHLHGERPIFEQLKQMHYFRYCLNESELAPSLVQSDKPILVSQHLKREYWPIAEVLRLYPPLPHNARIAVKDTILPTRGGGEARSPILIPPSTKVEFHIAALHRCKDLWGADAEEY